MDDNEEDETPNVDLSQSYAEGIERIIGTEKDIVSTYNVPEKVLEERKKFWDDYFEDYSRELSDEIDLVIDTLEPKTLKDQKDELLRTRMHLSPNLIQYWIDTGNHPCKALKGSKRPSGSGMSSREEDGAALSEVPTIKLARNNKQAMAEKDDNTSFSSVDTAAYILSNTNTTKRAETMAIVEGSKSCNINTSPNITNNDSMSSSTFVDKASKIDDSDNIFDSNGNDDQNQSKMSVSPEVKAGTAVEIQTESGCCNMSEPDTNSNVNTDKEIAAITSNSVSNCTKRSSSEHNNNNNANKNVSTPQKNRQEILKQLFDTVNKSDNNKRIRLDESINESLFVTSLQKSTCDLSQGLGNRKKLYSGRDSPVDLVTMRISSGNRMSNVKKILHPALDPSAMCKWKLKKQKVHSRKRKKLSRVFPESQDNYQSADSNTCGEDTTDDTEDDEVFEYTIDKNETELTETNKKVPDECKATSLNGGTLTKPGDARTNLLLNEIVSINDRRLNLNLSPRVCLDRLPQCKIQKYKKSSDPKINLGNLVPVVILTRISDQCPRYSKPLSNKTSQSKDELQSENADPNRIEKPVYSSDVQDINSDLESNQSTVLLCECKDGDAYEQYSISDSITRGSLDIACDLTDDECSSVTSMVHKRACRKPVSKLNNKSTLEKLGSPRVTGTITKVLRRKVDILQGNEETLLDKIRKNNPVVALTRLPLKKYNNGDDNVKRIDSCINSDKSPRVSIERLSITENTKNSKRNVLSDQTYGNGNRSPNTSSNAKKRAVGPQVPLKHKIIENSISSNSPTTSETIDSKNSSRNAKSMKKQEKNVSKSKTLVALSSDGEETFTHILRPRLRKRLKLRSSLEKESPGTGNEQTINTKKSDSIKVTDSSGASEKCTPSSKPCKFSTELLLTSDSDISLYVPRNLYKYNASEHDRSPSIHEKSTRLTRFSSNLGGDENVSINRSESTNDNRNSYDRRKRSVRRLCFQTRIFESDSESTTSSTYSVTSDKQYYNK